MYETFIAHKTGLVASPLYRREFRKSKQIRTVTMILIVGLKCIGFTNGGLLVHLVYRFTWCTGALVHLCTGALVHWFTGALVHWFTDALVHLLHWCTGSPVHRFTGSLVHWLTGALAHWCSGALVHLVHRCTGSLVHWCTGSPAGAMFHWFLTGLCTRG